MLEHVVQACVRLQQALLSPRQVEAAVDHLQLALVPVGQRAGVLERVVVVTKPRVQVVAQLRHLVLQQREDEVRTHARLEEPRRPVEICATVLS
eukprot:3939927-Rhodomonas_salina.1